MSLNSRDIIEMTLPYGWSPAKLIHIYLEHLFIRTLRRVASDERRICHVMFHFILLHAEVSAQD